MKKEKNVEDDEKEESQKPALETILAKLGALV